WHSAEARQGTRECDYCQGLRVHGRILPFFEKPYFSNGKQSFPWGLKIQSNPGTAQRIGEEIFRNFPNRVKWGVAQFDLTGGRALHAFASLGVFIFGKFRLDRRGGGLFR